MPFSFLDALHEIVFKWTISIKYVARCDNAHSLAIVLLAINYRRYRPSLVLSQEISRYILNGPTTVIKNSNALS